MLTLTTPVRLPLRATALAGLAAALMLAAPLSAFAQEAPSPSTTSAQAIRQIVTPDFTQIVKRYGPAVVNISVTGTRLVSAGGKDAPKGSSPEADDSDAMQSFLRKFQEQFGATGASMTVPVRGLGSGFIVSGDGLVLTNAHVVAHASEVTVKLTDRREFPARILGVDTKTDMAVLKIEAQNLPTVTIGSPTELNVGNGCWPSARPSGWTTQSPPEWSAPRPAPCPTTTPCPLSRPMPPSTPATQEDHYSTRGAKWWASIPKSLPAAAATRV